MGKLMTWLSKAIFVATSITALAAAFICIRIEVFNWRAGGFLPADPEGGTWRVLGLPRMVAEDGLLLKADPTGALLRQVRHEGRPYEFDEAQQREIEAQVESAEENTRFRDFVSTWGIAQYILAPLSLLLSVLCIRRTGKRRTFKLLGIATATMCILCIAIMWYRSYFSSLGW